MTDEFRTLATAKFTRRARLSQVEKNEIAARITAGDDPNIIAKDFRCTTRTVREIAQKNGLLLLEKRLPRQLAHKTSEKKTNAIKLNIYSSDIIRAIPLSRLMAGK
jgi:hypothetical protein